MLNSCKLEPELTTFDAKSVTADSPCTYGGRHRRQRCALHLTLLLAAEADERVKTVNFIASDNALRVFAEELAIKGCNNRIPH